MSARRRCFLRHYSLTAGPGFDDRLRQIAKTEHGVADHQDQNGSRLRSATRRSLNIPNAVRWATHTAITCPTIIAVIATYHCNMGPTKPIFGW